jgi:hypothetical protein
MMNKSHSIPSHVLYLCATFHPLQVRELFNPDYGMFVYDEATRFHWFRPSDLDIDTEFELVGILIGECDV